jgi:hypothetical protein
MTIRVTRAWALDVKARASVEANAAAAKVFK